MRARRNEPPVDDWLGDVSDDDWSENAAARADRRRGTPAYEELPAPGGDPVRDPTAGRAPPPRPVSAAEAHRAVIERRRLVAGLVVVAILAVAAVAGVLLLRGGEQAAQETPVTEPTVTTPVPGETSPPETATTPSTTTPTTTTPSTPEASSFTLPEGTKIRRGEEADPAVVSELQRALTSAGFDPGPADGTYGEQTEAAVVAFQQANDLSADGVVGPETAAALNSALAGG